MGSNGIGGAGGGVCLQVPLMREGSDLLHVRRVLRAQQVPRAFAPVPGASRPLP